MKYSKEIEKKYFEEINNGIGNIKNKNYTLAEINFLKALDLKKSQFSAYLNLANLYLINKDHHKAVSILSSVLF